MRGGKHVLPVCFCFQRPGSFHWHSPVPLHFPAEPLVVQMNALMVRRGAVDESVSLITPALCVCVTV